MTFVAFLIWVVIVAGTGYMLWKLVFQGRIGKKEEQEPMAVKTSEPESEGTEKKEEEEFHSDVVEAQEEPVAEEEEEALDEPEIVEGAEEEETPAEEEAKEPEKEK